MSPAEAEELEVRLAREIGRAWGELGGSHRDPAIAALAGAVQDLVGDAAERTPMFARRRRRGRPHPLTARNRGPAR